MSNSPNSHNDPCSNYSVTICQQKKTTSNVRARNLFSASVSLAERRLTRQRKFRYVSDYELGISRLRERSRSSPASPESAVQKLRLSGESGRGHWSFSAVPHPLPLPLPESLAGRKETDHQNNPYKNSTKSCQSHPYSPNLGPKRATISVSPVSPLRSPAIDTIMCSSPAPHNSHETKKPLKPVKLRASYSCKSAPTSPVASPRRAGSGDVSTYFALAAREFPDMQTGNATRKVIRNASKTQKAVSFPIRKKSSVSEEDNNSHANSHPLPLPPGVSNAVLPMRGHWKKGKLIGRGTFGSVYLGTNSETGALCAMKEVDLVLDDPKSVECIRQLEQEIRVLRQLKHPNIVQYYGSEVVDDHFYIYLEYVHPGSINKYAREHCGAVTESVVRNFTRHILSGLAYLHSTKTIHRDIKGANLLVDSSGVVKLADFGMAKHLTGPSYDLSLKGSPYWMAPEVIKAAMLKNASSCLALAVDVWSLGCTVIEMMNGKPPWSEFTGPQAMFRVLNNTPPIPEALSPEGKDFLNCCFRRNPADRPSAAKLLEHAFVRNSHHHHHHHHHQISPTAHGCLATSIMEKLNIQSGVSPTPTPSARMGISNGSPPYCGNTSSPWTLSL